MSKETTVSEAILCSLNVALFIHVLVNLKIQFCKFGFYSIDIRPTFQHMKISPIVAANSIIQSSHAFFYNRKQNIFTTEISSVLRLSIYVHYRVMQISKISVISGDFREFILSSCGFKAIKLKTCVVSYTVNM